LSIYPAKIAFGLAKTAKYCYNPGIKKKAREGLLKKPRLLGDAIPIYECVLMIRITFE